MHCFSLYNTNSIITRRKPMKVYILLLLSLLSASISYAIKPKTDQELATSPMNLLPAEIKVLIFEQLIDKTSFDNTLKNIVNFALTNREFNDIVNDPTNLKWLIETLENIFWTNSDDYYIRTLVEEPYYNTNIFAAKRKLLLEVLNQINETESRYSQILVSLNKGIIHPLLISKKFNINTRSRLSGRTLLHQAAKNLKDISDMESIFKTLIKTLGAKINDEGKEGSTPLMVAVEWENIQTIKELLKYDPNLQIKNKVGKTVFDLARDTGNLEIIKLLEDHQKNTKK